MRRSYLSPTFAITMTIPVLMLTALMLAIVSADQCPNPMYRRFSKEHTGCKAPNPSCKFIRTGVTEADKAEILKAHNDLRQKIASGGEMSEHGFPLAANMMKLEWDNELAFVAQAHANQCNFGHDCNECRQVNDFSVGQNLGLGMGSEGSQVVKDWTGTVKMFYDEIQFARPNIVSNYQFAAPYGHFSQVIWADTWKIGCGYAAYRSNRNPQLPLEQLYTCNYGPAGNMGNVEMYKSGPPASQCPGNTRRADDYPSLCQANDESGPKPVDDKKKRDSSMYFVDFTGNNVNGLRIQHQNNAFLMPSKTMTYLSFTPTAGQKVTVSLPRPMSSSTGFCVRTKTRTGATDATQQARSVYKMTIADASSGWKTESQMIGMPSAWQSFNMDLSAFRNPTNIGLTFEVPNGAAQQFLDIREIQVTAGKC